MLLVNNPSPGGSFLIAREKDVACSLTNWRGRDIVCIINPTKKKPKTVDAIKRAGTKEMMLLLAIARTVDIGRDEI